MRKAIVSSLLFAAALAVFGCRERARPAPVCAPPRASVCAPAPTAAATPAPAPVVEKAMVTEADLLHRRFVLETFDGEEIAVERRQPGIEFLEGMRIAGSACNRFLAPGKLENGVLTAAGPVASTLMMCPDEALNRLDQAIPRMLEAGVRVDLSEGVLILSGGGHVLVYRSRDWVN
ncbi:MAG: META domain-containing protein [Planctomycetota bacterium]|jgi:heat shock protein HslJ|nr:META domain-containing protein [Planctomycetota bacterium]